jgi:preprotein translocase subunit YajC
MSGRTIGNLILMTLICVVVFIVFMAVRPTKASAQNFQREAEIIRPRETLSPRSI